MKKRWMFVLIAAAILLVVFPVGSLAAGAGPQGGALLEESATAGETASEAPTPTPAPFSTATAPYVPTATPGPSVKINVHSADLYPGDTITLKAETSPAGLPITWSYDETTMEMIGDGIFKAKSVGQCLIDAYITGTDIYDRCWVSILPILVTSVNMPQSSYTIQIYQHILITVAILPENATLRYICSWRSSNKSVAFVYEYYDSAGFSDDTCGVLAAGIGTATITAMTQDGVYGTCQITVVDSSPSSSTLISDHPQRPSSTVTPTPAPTKYMDTSALPKPTREPVALEATGWQAAEEAVQTMETGSLGSIEAPEDDMLVPASLLDTLLQTQTALEIDCGDYFCVIDGAALTEVPEGLEAVDIGMTMEKDTALSAAWGGSAYELRFNYHGELPGTFTFRVKAEGSRPGDTVYLYYLNEDTDEFEGVHTAVVDDQGYVSLNITHCSSYYLTDSIIEGAANNFVLPAETEAAEEVQSGGFAAFVHNNRVAFWLCVYFLGMGIIAAVIVIVYRSIKRSGKPRDESVKHTTHIK